MSSNNVFFEQNGRKMYGAPFGYAIEYTWKPEIGDYVQLEKKMVIPEDPENWVKPIPTDLATEMLFNMAQEHNVIVRLYGDWVQITDKDTMTDIKRRIRQAQKRLVQIDPFVDNDVAEFLMTGIDAFIEWMPVY